MIQGTSLEVQWLRLHASTAGFTGLIPDQGSKIPHAMQCGQKKKKKDKKIQKKVDCSHSISGTVLLCKFGIIKINAYDIFL